MCRCGPRGIHRVGRSQGRWKESIFSMHFKIEGSGYDWLANILPFLASNLSFSSEAVAMTVSGGNPGDI